MSRDLKWTGLMITNYVLAIADYILFSFTLAQLQSLNLFLCEIMYKTPLIVLTVPKRNINIHQKLLLFLISHPTQKPQETGQDSTGSRCVTSQSTFQKRIYFSIITVFIVSMISPPVTVSVALSSFARTSTL